MDTIEKYKQEDYQVNIKKECVLCGYPIPGTWHWYTTHGNFCIPCGVRAEKVTKRLMTREESDRFLDAKLK